MKYKNAGEVLPAELLEEIQKYVQGEFLYVPIKERKNARALTEYRVELDRRNERIYRMSLEGVTNPQLARNFSLAQSSIRRIIIEQRKRYKLMSEKIKTLLPVWNLEGEAIKQIHGSVWQIGEDYVIKIYSDLTALRRNILINNSLESMGIPVGEIFRTTSGEEIFEQDGQYCFVCEKLSGSNIVSLKFGNKIGETMGRIIADLHKAFENIQKELNPWDNCLLEEMNGWVSESFEKSGWQSISKEEYEEVVMSLSKSYSQLPFQLIHRDVHFGNFLFDNGTFSGYIDFDLSQKNIRIFDLCYFVMSVLSEKEKFDLTEEKWFDFAKNVFAGYNKTLPLTEAEKQSAVYVMECIELLFMAFFEGQEDEALAQSTYKIFSFIKANERRITKLL